MKKEIKQLLKFFYDGVCFFLVGRKLKKNGLIKYVDIGHFYSCQKKIILDRYTDISYEEYQEQIIKVRKLFPKAKRLDPSSWSPYADVVIYQVLYKVFGVVHIAAWYQTTVEKVPSVLLHDGCKFVEETSKGYRLVCEAKG
jgi:hypothetical protein